MQVRSVERLNEVLGWVRLGVRDFKVPHANNPWEIRVPSNDTHTVYFWFYALFSCVSGSIPPSTLSASPDSNDINNDEFCRRRRNTDGLRISASSVRISSSSTLCTDPPC